MKKTFSAVAIFLFAYLGFLIATLPATAVVNQFPLPKKINLYNLSGSIWHSQVAQLVVNEVSINNVNIRLSVWSLFTLTPQLDITFGDSLIDGPEGQLVLELSQEKAIIRDLTLFIKANEIARQLTLPLPVTAQGNVDVTLDNVEILLHKKDQCSAASGVITWQRAGVVALEENIKLGQFKANVECENGALALRLSPKNNLGLTFNVYVRNGNRISGSGFLKPGSNFPQALQSTLSFLGKKDNQGRYRLSF